MRGPDANLIARATVAAVVEVTASAEAQVAVGVEVQNAWARQDDLFHVIVTRIVAARKGALGTMNQREEMKALLLDAREDTRQAREAHPTLRLRLVVIMAQDRAREGAESQSSKGPGAVEAAIRAAVGTGIGKERLKQNAEMVVHESAA